MGMVVTRFLMRAYPAIHSLSMVTVHAQDLQSFREPIFIEIHIGSISGRRTPAEYTPAKLGAVVVDVVERKKLFMRLTAACAFVPAICGEYDVLNAFAITLCPYAA